MDTLHKYVCTYNVETLHCIVNIA